MKAFAIHFLIETKSGFRKKQQLFLNYLFPIGFFLMMGAVMPQLNPLFLDDMIPAMIIFSLMCSTFLGIPDPIVNSRAAGIYRGCRINGVPASSLIILPVLSSIIHGPIVSTIIMLLSPLLFGAPLPLHLLPVLPLLILTVISFAGISVLIGTVSSSSRAATMLAQIIFIPSMLIGGLMIPFDFLPDSVKPFAMLLPSTHSMNLFKTLAFGRPPAIASGISAAVLAGTGITAFVLSRILFRWDSKKSAE